MKKFALTMLVVFVSSGATACGGAGWRPSGPQTEGGKVIASDASSETVGRFRSKAPRLNNYFDQAYAVAVFPSVGKGAATVGGAYGKGEVFEQGRRVGSAKLMQVSVGFAFGGQAYSEVIFFEDEAALDRFKSGNFELGADASAVAVTAGASAHAAYHDGVAVFTMTRGGLMYEASVAGQKFSYTSG